MKSTAVKAAGIVLIITALVVLIFYLFKNLLNPKNGYQLTKKYFAENSRREPFTPMNGRTQSAWDSIAGNIKGLKAAISPALEDQTFYDTQIGNVLGWFKGVNLNPSGANIWTHKAEIIKYLQSGAAKNVDVTQVGEYL